MRILRAANDENGKYVNFETELMVKCSDCQSSLNQKAVQYLLLSEMAGSIAMMGGGGSGLNQLLEGHCPKCGGTGCFYLFDPAGFEVIRGGHAAEPEKKKGFWPFRK